MQIVWEICAEVLTKTCNEHDLRIHSFVLMTNHFHLIATTPEANISQCMFQFVGLTSRKLAKEGNRINETFAGRHHKCILQNHNYYLNAYKYNYRNPVTAGICNLVEDYPYSTFQSVLGRSKPIIPILEDTTFNFDPTGTLKWLNEKPDPEIQEAVRFGLRHQFFKSKKNPSLNKSILADNETL